MEPTELRNEFAHVRVSIDTAANGPRLRIQDVKTGATTFLDPLELETLAWLRHADLAPLLNPSRGRRPEPSDPGLDRLLEKLGSE